MKLNPVIIELLKKRGIDTPEEIEEFLSDKPQKTYDPFLLPDMEEGVDLILSEIERNSKICIYGDYDADGITSTALMLGVLSNLTNKNNLDYYIPSRFEEGYGLNKDAIEQIADKGTDLIITVDCGSVSYDEVEYAKALGMKVIVTDHHNVTDVMADCILINPKHPKSQYPFKELSGCGVAFKVAQALQKKTNMPKHVLTSALDLAAIGTVGDIMPLVDENRTITKYGIKVINLGKREGLRLLMEGAGLKIGNVTSENISFVIVPHLNASGRIENAAQAVELLAGICRDDRMAEIVEDVLAKNIKRRKLQEELFKACESKIDNQNLGNIIIMESESSHEGIAGIVAGKLKEKYYRPSIIVTPTGANNEDFKGTGRSIEGVNLYDLLKTQEHLFEKFGGHAGACGFSLKKDNFEKLKHGLEKKMEQIYNEDTKIFRKKYPIDLELEVSELTVDLADEMELLAPFGNKNSRPLIMLKDVIISDHRYMGKEGQHVRFFAEEPCGGKIQCVLFGKAQDVDFEKARECGADIVGRLENQLWQGVKRLQLIAEEIEIDEKLLQ